MKLDILVRDLHSGEKSLVTFEALEDARAWLAARPKYTDVMGVASHHLEPAVEDELRTHLRPLDEEERLLERKLVAEADVEVAKGQLAELAEAERRARAQQDELDISDPDRPMNVHYVFNKGLDQVDPRDRRPITEAARQAVMEWIDERNSWVKSRNQIVAEATVQVWPGAIPAGEGERVIGGSFVPVTA